MSEAIPRRYRRAVRDLRAASLALRDAASLADELDGNELAAAAEALRRSLGVELYDCQLLAGWLLTDRPRGLRGRVVEMATGEGKTFAAFLAAAAFAASGRGVHVVTSNAYLAERDAEQLRPAFDLLGLRVAALPEGQTPDTPAAKRDAYAADVTYGTGYEFGFDYLRDRTAAAPPRRRFADRLAAARPRPTQRGLRHAIIDEVDHVLLDDACSPLVLAASSGRSAPDEAAVHAAARIAEGFGPEHFRVDASGVRLSPAGEAAAYDALTGDLAAALLRPWTEYVVNALHAARVFARDVHYLIRADEVRIVDQSTGRIFEDRTWSEGLHQAVEAKEGLPVRDANRTLARVTRQRFYGLYERACGLTGTAAGSRREFRTVYGLDVVGVPRNRPSRLTVGPLRCFGDAASRWDAVAAEAAEVSRTGRPVLIGTASIASSLAVLERLEAAGVAASVLNGTQDAEEATVIAAAGRPGVVTVATNLAGRGTDIRLGPGVAEAGGLHVVAAEAMPSARVLRQLVGRAGRQGDPGTASRFASAEDDALHAAAPWLCEQLARRGPGPVSGDVGPVVDRVTRSRDRSLARGRIALWNRDRDRDGLAARIAAATA